MSFFGSISFNLRFEELPNHRSFLDLQKVLQKLLSTFTDFKYEMI